jgi:RNA polymerase sigma factor (sigma-70 family)
MLPHLNFFPQHNRSDQEIIENLLLGQQASRKAEEQLFSTYSYYIKEGMRRYSLQEEEAFDAYSDTIISAVQSIVDGTFERRSSLKTYLYKVFMNRCVDVIRKNTTNKSSIYRTLEVSSMLQNMSDGAKNIIQQLAERSDLEEMKRRLSQLGDACKSLLMMFAEGYSDREIALSMEYKSADVVKTSRLRCLQKLRQQYVITQEK